MRRESCTSGDWCHNALTEHARRSRRRGPTVLTETRADLAGPPCLPGPPCGPWAGVNAGIVFPRSAGIRFPRSDVIMFTGDLLFLLCEVVEDAGFALLA